MGNFYTNITIKGAEQRQIAETLRPMNRSAIVSPTVDGLTVVFDAASESQDESIFNLAQSLSEQLQCVALAAMNHDDDILCLQLFRGGVLIDSYNSCPNYFSGEPIGPAGGNAAALCEAFGKPDGAHSQIEEILRADSLAEGGNQRYVFEVMRHLDLAQALGLSSFAVGAGFNSFEEDDVPEGLRLENCIVLKDSD